VYPEDTMNASLRGGNLLVGIDFSENCVRALLHAVTLAEQVQTGVDLVHVASSQAHTMLARLGQICSSFVADRVPAEIHLLIGDPAAQLLEAASQTSSSIIILGALGRNAGSQRSVGTTAEEVCEHSPIPVLLIPLLHREKDLEGGMLFQPAHCPIVWNCSTSYR
jgi:nucleotide-binding universal stress UspA family protein